MTGVGRVLTIAQLANSMSAFSCRPCYLEAIEKLTRRDNFDVMVTLERKQIAAVAADDDRAPSLHSAFEHAIVGRAACNDVDRFFRHSDLGNAVDRRRQNLDFMVREGELVRAQHSLEFVY